jgi:hypothetical protein
MFPLGIDYYQKFPGLLAFYLPLFWFLYLHGSIYSTGHYKHSERREAREACIPFLFFHCGVTGVVSLFLANYRLQFHAYVCVLCMTMYVYGSVSDVPGQCPQLHLI